MPNIFKEEVSLIFCDIYYFSRNEEEKGIRFFSVWVKDGVVVKCPLGKLDVEKGMDAEKLVDKMKQKGYALDII